MDYATAVRETWRHQAFSGTTDTCVALVRYAALAASSHNTQPWVFRQEADGILIQPDLSRQCPAVDPDDHHLYASLGCAAQNLLIAAPAAGLHGHLSYDASRSSAWIDLEKGPSSRSALFEAIPRRQCSRAEYDGQEIPSGELRLLEEAGGGAGVSVMLLKGNTQKGQIAEYVAEGNTAQFGDRRWSEELRSWIRFSAGEAVRTRDGLYGPVMGSPDVPRWLGELFMRFVFSAKRQNRKDFKHIKSSGAIAVFFSEADDKAHWIEVGRCYQRMALQAAVLNLRTAFINQPVEVSDLRPQFASFLGIGNRRPDLVVRIGRGPEMPRSLRRPVEHVLVRPGQETS